MITLNYSSNNSGGSWWLKDKDWQKLEANGWKVDWYKDQTGGFAPYKDGRWLGALASSASKKFETADQGIQEWQDLTGQDPWDEGCNCCGNPHNFSYLDSKGQSHYAEIQRSTTFGGWS